MRSNCVHRSPFHLIKSSIGLAGWMHNSVTDFVGTANLGRTAPNKVHKAQDGKIIQYSSYNIYRIRGFPKTPTTLFRESFTLPFTATRSRFDLSKYVFLVSFASV